MAAGSITFSLLMNTASFETDSKKAEKRIKELKKEAESLGKSLGVAVVSGAAAMVYALKQSIDAMDGVGEAAQRIGTTTEALSAMQYAAKQGAVSAEELESGMIKLASAAVDGNEGLAAIGVSTKDAAGGFKDTSALLVDVAEKFAKYKDGAEKTAIAVEIFGKAGATLIPLLNQGRDGIEALTKEAAAMGVVVGTDAANAAGKLNDNLDRLAATLSGSLKTGASELMPVLLAISEYLIDGAKNGNALTGAFSAMKTVLQAVTVLGSDVAFVFSMVGKEIGVVLAQIRTFASGDFKGAKLLGEEWTAEAARARKDLDDFQARVMGVQVALGSAAVTGDAGTKIAAPIVVAAEKTRKAAKVIDTAAKEAAAAYKKLVDEGARLTESVQTPAEKLAGTKANVGKLADAGVINPETQQRALADAEAAYQEYVQAQRDMLTDGLLSEEDEIAKSYERRKQMILSLTEATESEKADAIASLSEKAELDQAAARMNRYRDLLDQETVVTADYQARRREIENDETLGAEERTQYLISLSEKYHARMDELDAETQAKKDAAFKAQIDLVSSGFAGAAELAKAFAGEQSGTYKAMFAASKAFAIADIALKQAQAIAKAWGENNYFVAAGLTVGLAAQFASLISSASGASFGGTRADGGSVNEGRSYLVGERGPEMFTPTAGGTIIPNDALQGGQQPAANIRIVNAFDNAVIGDYMGGSDGERLVMNAVRRNQGAIRQLVSA